MSAAVAAQQRVLHAIPGRVRVHLPEWSRRDQRRLESRIHRLPGVRSVQANILTSNVLIRFDPAATDVKTILAGVSTIEPNSMAARDEEPVLQEGPGRIRWRRSGVRHLERDPWMAHWGIGSLEPHPRARTRAHPPDSAPSMPSATCGAALAPGRRAVRQLADLERARLHARGAGSVSGVISLLQGVPLIRSGLGRLLGEDLADRLVQVAGVVSQMLSSSPLGIILGGLEILGLLVEFIAWCAARPHSGRLATSI